METPQNTPSEKRFALSDKFGQEHSLLRLVLGAVPVGLTVVDQDLIIQAFNAKAEELTGLKAAEAIGRPYAEVMQTTTQNIADPLEEAIATGQTFVNQRFYLRPHATPETSRPIRHSASLLTDEKGQTLGGLTIFADISRQVEMEQTLEGQRQYLRALLHAIPDGVATVNPDLLIEDWNEAAVALTGYSAAEAKGESSAKILGPTLTSLVETLFTEEKETLLAQETSLPLANGDRLPVNFSLGLLFSPTSRQQKGVIIFRDISERLTHEKELAYQRHYLGQVLILAPYGIISVDENLIIQTFNQAAEALIGYADSFAIGKPYHDIVKIDSTLNTDPLPQLMSNGHSVENVRLKLTDVSGKKITVRYSLAPLLDTEDQRLGAIVIFDNISDIVAAERTKNEFLSMVSHELRTPMTSIKGFVSAVLSGRAGEITAKQKHFLSICRDQTDHLLTLINELLDLTRLESGKIELSRNRVDLPALIKQSIKVIAPMAQRKQLSVVTDIAPDLPRFWGDQGKMLQVMQNLLNNAVKFTPPEGQITVTAASKTPQTIQISITDEGVGIAPEDQDRIFEPFYQVENIQIRQAGGTGLGLPIVKKIIEAHKGQISVVSTPGQGSKFIIQLPVTAPPEPKIFPPITSQQDDASVAPASKPPPRSPRATPLVLVVDDDPSTNALIEFTLEEEGYQVITAANGEGALRLAGEEQPDLITLDILMPEMDGFHVLDLLKKNSNTAHIPVCIVSIIEDKVKGYRLGAIDYISKPFEEQELIEAIGSVLQPSTYPEQEKILVIEDDPSIVELIEMSLNELQYQVVTAHDGVAALEQLRDHLPTLIILDIMIPKLNGYEFIRQAKSDPRTADIPIIVLSVRALEEDISRALRLGADKYLTKAPGTEDELVNVIHQIMEEVPHDDSPE